MIWLMSCSLAALAEAIISVTTCLKSESDFAQTRGPRGAIDVTFEPFLIWIETKPNFTKSNLSKLSEINPPK